MHLACYEVDGHGASATSQSSRCGQSNLGLPPPPDPIPKYANALSVDLRPQSIGSFICSAKPPAELVPVQNLLRQSDQEKSSGNQAQADASFKEAADKFETWAQGVLNDPNASNDDLGAVMGDFGRMGVEPSDPKVAPYIAKAFDKAKSNVDKAATTLSCPPTRDQLVNLMKAIRDLMMFGVDPPAAQQYGSNFAAAGENYFRGAALALPPGGSAARSTLVQDANASGLPDLAQQIGAAGMGGPPPDPPKCGGFQFKFPLNTSAGANVTEGHTCGPMTGSHWTAVLTTTMGGRSWQDTLDFDVPKGGGRFDIMPPSSQTFSDGTTETDHIYADLDEAGRSIVIYFDVSIDGQSWSGQEAAPIEKAAPGVCPGT